MSVSPITDCPPLENGDRIALRELEACLISAPMQFKGRHNSSFSQLF
jgi:hypothetical protein